MSDENEVKEVSQEQVVEQPQEIKSQEEPKKNESNHWAQANEVMRLQKQRIDELEAYLSQSKAKEAPKADQDEFDKLDPEDYVTVGKAKELAKKLAAKEAEVTATKLIQEHLQQQTIARDEERMRSKHDDYDYVIENFATSMIKNDPALAYKIQTSKNPAETAYKLAKLSDEYEESMKQTVTSPKAEKVLKNASRPVSSQAVSPSLKTQAEDFSKMSKEDVWAMSQKFARGA